MLGAQFCLRTVSGGFHGTSIDRNQRNAIRSRLVSSFHLPVQQHFNTEKRRRSFRIRSSIDGVDHDHDFFEASLLVPEIISHHRMRRQGFRDDDVKWENSRRDFTSIRQDFLSSFQDPTIFLKISCSADFLLPIIVGEFAIEKLVEALLGDDNRDCPDQFQFAGNVVEKLGYQVKMVRITERVVNTYIAKLYLSKPGKNDVISVDARPSDAINVAKRCKAPIYVNKQIVLADAIRIGYKMGRVRDVKPTCDAYLDSAIEGSDSLIEELDLVRNIDIAVKEERYNDAAKLRDELLKLRKSRL